MYTYVCLYLKLDAFVVPMHDEITITKLVNPSMILHNYTLCVTTQLRRVIIYPIRHTRKPNTINKNERENSTKTLTM